MKKKHRRPLGVRQQSIVESLCSGWRLFYEVGQTFGSNGRTFSLGSYTKAYLKKNKTAKDVPVDPVLRLVDREILTYKGEFPEVNCFRRETLVTELKLDKKALPTASK